MSRDRKPTAALCRVDEISEAHGKEVLLPGDGDWETSVALFRRGERVIAYYNTCPHAGRPLNWAPDRFLFTPAGHLVCTAHGATFVLETGQCILGPCAGAHLRAFPIRIDDGRVYPTHQPAG